ncbi:PEBP-like protein [Ceratobasidium sp. AG-I]|nr:PEBP-like protein [Ceratobasidium sp. AG-I]
MRFATLFTSIVLSLGLVDAVAIHKCTSHKTAHTRPSLKEVKTLFKEAKIVPDLLPVFKPSSLLYLTYGNSSLRSAAGLVLPGKKFAKDVTEDKPEISLEGPGWPGAYVFFLLDPDAPSRSDPKWAQVRHMFAGNLTVSDKWGPVPNSVVLKNLTGAVNDYMPPAPPAGTGPHRYVALLYAQPRDFDYSFLNTTARKGFNLTEFAVRSGLGTPLAGTFLTVKVKEEDNGYWLLVIRGIWSYWRQIAFKILF